jgi:hypothetical protein
LLRADVRLQAPIAFGCLALAIVMPSYFRDGYYQFYGLVGLLLPVAVLLAAFVSHWSPSSIGANRAYPLLALVLKCLISIAIDRFLVKPVDVWRQQRVRAVGDRYKPVPVKAFT